MWAALVAVVVGAAHAQLSPFPGPAPPVYMNFMLPLQFGLSTSYDPTYERVIVSGSSLLAFNATTGKQLWTFTCSQYCGPVTYTTNPVGFLAVGDYLGGYIVDLVTGTSRFSPGPTSNNSPQVVAVTGSGYVAAVATATTFYNTGTILISAILAGGWTRTVFPCPTPSAYVNIAGGTVDAFLFVSMCAGTVSGLEPKTGTARWVANITAPITHSAVVTVNGNDVAIVQGITGTTMVVNASDLMTGEPLWAIQQSYNLGGGALAFTAYQVSLFIPSRLCPCFALRLCTFSRIASMCDVSV